MGKRPFNTQKDVVICPFTNKEVEVQTQSIKIQGRNQILFITCDNAVSCTLGDCKYKPKD